MQIASLSRSLQGQWQRLRQAVVRPSATGDVSSQDATPAMSRRTSRFGSWNFIASAW